MTGAEWTDIERAEAWPSCRQSLPHASNAEAMLVEHLLDRPVERVLDLGTGDGHLVALLLRTFPDASAIGMDISPAMVQAAEARFTKHEGVSFLEHDLMRPLPDDLGQFDLIVSALAIHHLPNERKRRLFAEVFARLDDGGRFYDLDCVVSPSVELHQLSQHAFGFDCRGKDPSDQPATLQDHLDWLIEAGFRHVDCHWKWMELTLVGGRKLR